MANRVPTAHDCPNCGWHIRKWEETEAVIQRMPEPTCTDNELTEMERAVRWATDDDYGIRLVAWLRKARDFRKRTEGGP